MVVGFLMSFLGISTPFGDWNKLLLMSLCLSLSMCLLESCPCLIPCPFLQASVVSGAGLGLWVFSSLSSLAMAISLPLAPGQVCTEFTVCVLWLVDFVNRASSFLGESLETHSQMCCKMVNMHGSCILKLRKSLSKLLRQTLESNHFSMGFPLESSTLLSPSCLGSWPSVPWPGVLCPNSEL